MAYDWLIDKQLGHMHLYEHTGRPERIKARIKLYKTIVQSTDIPSCTCGTVQHGKSGNLALDVRASYSLFKHCCFPGLRTFIYSNGPVYLTKVVSKPDVLEVDRDGNPI